jgi:hypothetical protein
LGFQQLQNHQICIMARRNRLGSIAIYDDKEMATGKIYHRGMLNK